MKRTLKRELNSTWNCWKGSACDQTWAWLIIRGSPRCTLPAQASISSPWGIKASGTWLSPGSVIARCVIPCGGLRFAHSQGCWRNGHQWPVLKHGPRSRLRMRVFGCQTPTRNESERRWELRRIIDRSWCYRMDLSKSIRGRTRKKVNYACVGWSQRKLWWRLAAVLTCKSIVEFGYRGEKFFKPRGLSGILLINRAGCMRNTKSRNFSLFSRLFFFPSPRLRHENSV